MRRRRRTSPSDGRLVLCSGLSATPSDDGSGPLRDGPLRHHPGYVPLGCPRVLLPCSGSARTDRAAYSYCYVLSTDSLTLRLTPSLCARRCALPSVGAHGVTRPTRLH